MAGYEFISSHSNSLSDPEFHHYKASYISLLKSLRLFQVIFEQLLKELFWLKISLLILFSIRFWHQILHSISPISLIRLWLIRSNKRVFELFLQLD